MDLTLDGHALIFARKSGRRDSSEEISWRHPAANSFREKRAFMCIFMRNLIAPSRFIPNKTFAISAVALVGFRHKMNKLIDRKKITFIM